MLALKSCGAGVRRGTALLVPFAARAKSSASSCAGSSSGSADSTGASEMRTDDFPYSRISSLQLERLGAKLGESQLPMRALFAQHRPLMPIPRPSAAQTSSLQVEDDAATTAADVDEENILFVPVRHPKDDVDGFHEMPWRAVPDDIAQSLGAFDVAAPRRPNPVAQSASVTRSVFPAEVRKSLGALAALLEPSSGPVHLQRGDTVLRIETEAEEVNYEAPEISATSVRRKRKLKMNRHKYRKRLKQQRTLRRRLGK